MTGDWIDHQGGSVRADCGADGMTWKIVVEMPKMRRFWQDIEERTAPAGGDR